MRNCLVCMWERLQWEWSCTTTTLRRWSLSSSRPGTSPTFHSRLGKVQPVRCLQSCLPLHRWEHRGCMLDSDYASLFTSKPMVQSLVCSLGRSQRGWWIFSSACHMFPMMWLWKQSKWWIQTMWKWLWWWRHRTAWALSLSWPAAYHHQQKQWQDQGREEEEELGAASWKQWNWCRPSPFTLIAAHGSDQHNSKGACFPFYHRIRPSFESWPSLFIKTLQVMPISISN